MTIQETIMIAGLFQAITAKIYQLRSRNMNYIIYQRSLINENKWRASRYGIEGKLIDFGKETEVDTRALLLELLDFVDDVVDELGSRPIIQMVHQSLEKGTGADRQLAVFQQYHSLTNVVDYIQQQFLKV
jgi:carboxylate-amine ligase